MSGLDTQNYPRLSRGDVFVMSNETQVLLTNTNVIHKCTWSDDDDKLYLTTLTLSAKAGFHKVVRIYLFI